MASLPPTVSAAQAVSGIQSGQTVYFQSVSATPKALIGALVDRARAGEVTDLKLFHLLSGAYVPFVAPDVVDHFYVEMGFVSGALREAVNDGRANYIPIFLSEAPRLIRKGLVGVDVALINVSPPDKRGFCSMGASVDVTNAAVDNAKVVIAQINPHVPRTYGDGFIHVSRINALVENNDPLDTLETAPPDAVETAIGQYCASLVDDGATLQLGIGAIPNAALAAMKNHKHLGLHTEMFSDGIVDLVEAGVIDGTMKTLHHEKIVAGFALGSRRLYDFMDDNLQLLMLDQGYVNDNAVIRQNRRMTAINSAIEIDLTGQICADSIGTRQFSGVGGQLDFVMGASLAEEGKPIIALPSSTSKGESRLVPILKPGAGVVTTRAHVHYVVTEYGIANLYGMNMRKRARALIDIAHPAHREALEKAAFERFKKL